MNNYVGNTEAELKPDLEPVTPICRCCLSTQRQMKDVSSYQRYFMDLAGINVLESDGLPQWVCWECAALLQKATKFKYKMLKAHTLLYEYLTRCAPFSLDAKDPELSKYCSPQLATTPILSFDNGSKKHGYQKVLQHLKQIHHTDLDTVDIDQLAAASGVKEETTLSDYEDNITLDEYKSNVTKLTEEDLSKVTEDDLAALLEASEKLRDEPAAAAAAAAAAASNNKNTKRKHKKQGNSVKRKNTSAVAVELEELTKTPVRKPVELDPAKIKVVTLNPDEQIKQREEESKMNIKFPFQCHLCYRGFNFETKLQNHMTKHSPSRGQFECILCNMYLPTSYSFSVHSLIHTRRYECLQCGRRMIDRASILDHYRTQHEGQVTMYTCHICGKVSNNNKTHRGHMRNHHSGERPSCDQCGKSFVNKDSLAEHIQIHQGIKNYECGTCGKRFRTRTQIKHHQLKHSDSRDFYCVECDTRFKSAHSLRQHLRKSLKHKDKQSLKFECPRCDKRFDTDAKLQHHVSIQHEGVRSHRCEQCGATLATAGSLHKHVNSVHGGLRPAPRHVCHACGKAFRGKSVLVNHVRTHTGEKPFECGECGRKFTQRTAMRTHVKLVHLKMRTHKIKPELPLEVSEGPKLDMFPKEEAPLVFESWRAGPPVATCDLYFHAAQP